MLSNIRAQVLVAFSSLTALIIIGTVMYRHLEGWTWIQSFYFCVVTIATVGYGDLYPTTEASRLFTAFYILIGAAIALFSLSIIGMNYLRRREEKVMERRRRKG
jgi:voltage-gated potassium channel